MAPTDSFKARTKLAVGSETYTAFSLELLRQLPGSRVDRLPFTLKVLLENLVRNEDGQRVTADDVRALATWDVHAPRELEIAFRVARVLLQDFTGVPAVADLAAMRDAMVRLGGDPARVNPIQPVDLVIDHSLQVDVAGNPEALKKNVELEYARNRERYSFLRWGQRAFENFRVVPPGTGICHQVNLEHLASVVFVEEANGERVAMPDTLVGTDSHTTMINGLGVLGWGVGGIEAEAAMLGQPLSMLVPEVIGFRLSGTLPEGATATDLVLTVTQMLRKKGVVGKIVEFYGPGITSLSLADRATLANMAPEYGATAGFFPVDAETLAYLRLTGRPESRIQLAEAYLRSQGLFRDAGTPDPDFGDTLSLDLSTIEPSIAGPRRPQDRIPLKSAKAMFSEGLAQARASAKKPGAGEARVLIDGKEHTLRDGAVVIASITSCTNTSNPSVLLSAGLLAKKAAERGLSRQPWVKTSLNPGSKVVTDYLVEAGLMPALEALGFHLAGYGCATCIGNSGPLLEPVAAAVDESGLVVAGVLSGNRNFEGRVHPQVRMNYLASPPLVVAYALAGRAGIDFASEPLGEDRDGKPVFLKDVWPSSAEVAEASRKALRRELFERQYANVFAGDERWRGLPAPDGTRFEWTESTYLKRPAFFDTMTREPAPMQPIVGARVLARLGDSITTDHISPAGSIKPDSPAGRWLIARGVAKADFNAYGARRGNDEVMVRGTFANVRLRNELVPGTEGGFTTLAPGGEVLPVYDAAMRYRADGVPLVILAGKEYGTGSSRDWAAKGTALLGVRAVIAESFERIHRSNLVGMGLLPLQFLEGETRDSLGLTGFERYTIEGVERGVTPGQRLTVHVESGEGAKKTFQVRCRVDTPEEASYLRHGGILPYVLRQLLE